MLYDLPEVCGSAFLSKDIPMLAFPLIHLILLCRHQPMCKEYKNIALSSNRCLSSSLFCV